MTPYLHGSRSSTLPSSSCSAHSKATRIERALLAAELRQAEGAAERAAARSARLEAQQREASAAATAVAAATAQRSRAPSDEARVLVRASGSSAAATGGELLRQQLAVLQNSLPSSAFSTPRTLR